jgi:hypothetical protein
MWASGSMSIQTYERIAYPALKRASRPVAKPPKSSKIWRGSRGRRWERICHRFGIWLDGCPKDLLLDGVFGVHATIMGMVARHLGIERVGWRPCCGRAPVLVKIFVGKNVVCAGVMWQTI